MKRIMCQRCGSEHLHENALQCIRGLLIRVESAEKRARELTEKYDASVTALKEAKRQLAAVRMAVGYSRGAL